jgi:plasmid maintenance system killer protein
MDFRRYAHHELAAETLGSVGLRRDFAAGQYSMTLTGNYRLVVEKVKEDRVRIMEVEDYHGD